MGEGCGILTFHILKKMCSCLKYKIIKSEQNQLHKRDHQATILLTLHTFCVMVEMQR